MKKTEWLAAFMLGIFWGVFCVGFVFLTVEIAKAHPQDRELVETRTERLGFDDPVFGECFFDYWHLRRQFVLKTIEYGQCVGALTELVAIRQFDPALLNIVRHDILNYWNVIPAVPVLEKEAILNGGRDPENGASSLDYCRANVGAAEFAIADTETALGHCSFWRWVLG